MRGIVGTLSMEGMAGELALWKEGREGRIGIGREGLGDLVR